jgi:hypothetical protein
MKEELDYLLYKRYSKFFLTINARSAATAGTTSSTSYASAFKRGLI